MNVCDWILKTGTTAAQAPLTLRRAAEAVDGSPYCPLHREMARGGTAPAPPHAIRFRRGHLAVGARGRGGVRARGRTPSGDTAPPTVAQRERPR